MTQPTSLHGSATTLLSLLPLLIAACSAAQPHAPSPAPLQPAPPPTSATASTPTAAPDTTAAAPAPLRKRADLRFDVDGEDFPTPLVDVIVSGQPTTMLVDTGATHQVVASWVADQIGTVKSTGEAGVDHAGKSIALSRLDKATLSVSGWGPIGGADMFVITMPASLQRLGIGGVLSPQALAGEGRAVVLDLRKKTMSEASLEDAMKALEAEPGASFSGEVRSCGEGSGALPFAKASVAGTEVDAQIDTGATRSTVRASSDIGIKLKPLAKGSNRAVAASGSFLVPTIESAHVKLGGLEVDTAMDIVNRSPHAACTNDVLLGMDMLKRCVIVLGKSVTAAKCQAP